jgi:hypothetical protein
MRRALRLPAAALSVVPLFALVLGLRVAAGIEQAVSVVLRTIGHGWTSSFAHPAQARGALRCRNCASIHASGLTGSRPGNLGAASAGSASA